MNQGKRYTSGLDVKGRSSTSSFSMSDGYIYVKEGDAVGNGWKNGWRKG